jgi:Fe-Mn family superoxide dismutase
VDKDGKLEVLATSNADTPMAHGVRCLLTLDVWEHAYYVDYRNERERYVQAVIEKRLNWAFAEENLNRR